jgi:hypothetical protein
MSVYAKTVMLERSMFVCSLVMVSHRLLINCYTTYPRHCLLACSGFDPISGSNVLF